MGRHNEWRKIVKKLRRKRVRQQVAKIRTDILDKERKALEASPTYINAIKEQEVLALFEEQEEERLAKEKEEEWLRREAEQQKDWRELQRHLETIRQDRLKEEERICQEWMKEQEQVKEQKARIKELKEENARKSELVKEKIDEFIVSGGALPEELNISIETNPNKQTCPFFQKTGACRFKDVCSRNHIRPGASKVLLFPSFYTHFSLHQPAENEYGSDQNLECDDREMYNHFREFFNDILPEFDKFGRVRQLKVCRNKEQHLRGNVYVEFSTIREALKAYKTFQGRWYGGKQLNVEFCTIPSWKSAICGLSFKKRCPKGSLCNFLHVFMNPGKMFIQADRDLHRSPIHDVENDFENRNSSRRWRWSESPERDVTEKENYDHKSRHNGKHRHREERGEKSRDKRKSTYRSSSKSSTKSRRSRSTSSHRRKKRRSRS